VSVDMGLLLAEPGKFGKVEAARILALERLLREPVVSVDGGAPRTIIEHCRAVEAAPDAVGLPNELWALVFAHIVPPPRPPVDGDKWWRDQRAFRAARLAFGQCCKDFCAMFRTGITRIGLSYFKTDDFGAPSDAWWLMLPRLTYFEVDTGSYKKEDVNSALCKFLQLTTDEQRHRCEVKITTNSTMTNDTLERLMASVHTLHVSGMSMLRQAVLLANQFGLRAHRANLAFSGDYGPIAADGGFLPNPPGVAHDAWKQWNMVLPHSFITRDYKRYPAHERARWHIERPEFARPRLRLRLSEHTYAALCKANAGDDGELHWWHILDMQIDQTLMVKLGYHTVAT